MTAYFRVTTEDLQTGEKESMEVAEGEYVLSTFGDCYVSHVARHATGTVQITLRDHHPAGPARNRYVENAQGQVVAS